MKKIGIIAKPQSSGIRKVIEGLTAWLIAHGCEVFMDTDTAATLEIRSPHKKSAIPSLVEMIIVLGGDGTLLSVARLVEGKDVPILGVNVGGLGFLTEVTHEELYQTLEKVFNNEFIMEERLLLKAQIFRHGELVARSFALNDVMVSKGTLAKMIRLEIYADNQFVSALRGDGVIVSTPTGSTAYSLSAGGPILHPSVDAMILTPICPHTLTNRPIVIPDHIKIETILKSKEEGVMATFDGQVGFSLRQEDVVEIRASETKTKLIHSPAIDYYEVLRRKLKWGEG
jgi:NAD+ kinase